MKGKRKRLKIADLKRQSVRQSTGSPEEVSALARSWLARPVHDIVITPSWVVADGHRRLDGLELIGETEVDVLVLDEELDEKGLLQVALTTAIHRADLSGWDKWQAALRLKELCGCDQQGLAALLGLSSPMISKILSPSKCTPRWQEGLKDGGKVSLSDCEVAARLPADAQNGLLELKLSNGMNREALKAAAQKIGRDAAKTGPDVPPERTARVRIPLAVATKEVTAHGTVTVAGRPGEELSLAEAETLLKESLRAVREAQGRGLGLKAAQAAWRDIAAKNGAAT